MLERSGSAEKEQKKQAQKENGWNDRERQRKKEEINFFLKGEKIYRGKGIKRKLKEK